MTHNEIIKALEELRLKENLDWRLEVNGLHIDYLLSRDAMEVILSKRKEMK